MTYPQNPLAPQASTLPSSARVQTISIDPLTIPAPGRPREIEVRLTLPTTGANIPVVLLSHGAGPSTYLPSKDGYAPLATHLAAHGFAVLQPTHLNAKVRGGPPNSPEAPLFWKGRAGDFSAILDRKDIVEAAFGVAGRLDWDAVGVVGHSMGGFTAALLLGATVTDPKDESVQRLSQRDHRIKGGVLIGAPGYAGAKLELLSEWARQNASWLNLDFTGMHAPALVVAGDRDVSPHMTTQPAEWHADGYRLAPGRKALAWMGDCEHGFGGIAGWDAKEVTDASPELLEGTLRIVTAWFKKEVAGEPGVWNETVSALKGVPAVGKVEEKE